MKIPEELPVARKKTDEMDVEVGRHIRSQRKILKISQKDVAVAVGITFQQLQKYEKGVNRVGASRLSQIAKALNVDIAYFFEKQVASDEQSEPIDELMSFLATPEGVSLNRAFVKIKDQKVKRAFLSFVKAISERSR